MVWNFCPLLSHHPVREMKPGIIYRAGGPHFPLKESLFRLSCAQFRCPALNMPKEITQCSWCFFNPHPLFFIYLNAFSLWSVFVFENPIILSHCSPPGFISPQAVFLFKHRSCILSLCLSCSSDIDAQLWSTSLGASVSWSQSAFAKLHKSFTSFYKLASNLLELRINEFPWT